MPNYIVERHLPRFTSEQLAAAASRAKTTTGEMSGEGTPVKYLRSFFVPGEDKCYCLFAAPSAEVVRQANERAALPYQRISEALHISAEDVG
jgi:hypothetical protein